jgi:electron transfer flavoprotein alpha subunit
MRPLVVLEERDGALAPGAGGMIAKARELGGTTSALLCGSGIVELGKDAAALGSDRVLLADDPALSGSLPQPRVDVLEQLIRLEGFDAIVFENSSLAADVAAGLSARLDAGVNWDLVDLGLRDGELVGSRLALGDRVLVSVGWKGEPRIAVMRRGVLEPAAYAATGEIENVRVPDEVRSHSVRLMGRADAQAGDSSLEQAEIVVAAGRGIRDRADLKLLEQLAEALGASVAVTMPLVDRGWYPYSHQVGQTGRTVKPRLYLACGISGAIQHRVGMDKAETIVAINTDPTAPIFGFADVGVVADLYEFVPRLIDRLRSHRAEATALSGPP